MSGKVYFREVNQSYYASLFDVIFFHFILIYFEFSPSSIMHMHICYDVVLATNRQWLQKVVCCLTVFSFKFSCYIDILKMW